MIELIQQRFDTYEAENAGEEEQAIKEIIQEIALFALWRVGFFKVAAFHGGTSLRVIHGLPRFSEDLDFILRDTTTGFDWGDYLGKTLAVLQEYGLNTEVKDKSRMDQRVRKALLKDNSISSQLDLTFFRRAPDQKQTIKLEIDINPPEGSGFDYTYKDFPIDFEICHQDLPSNFALKIHALLCRPYLKGRDWYDFNWYVRQGIKPNLTLLQNALIQYGPWEGQALLVDTVWLKKCLKEKVAEIDWQAAASDVERFLKPAEQDTLKLWNERFFNTKADQL